MKTEKSMIGTARLKKSDVISSMPLDVTQEQRLHMIEEAAYYQAEHRGFQGGDLEQDWYNAETEIDKLLSH